MKRPDLELRAAIHRYSLFGHETMAEKEILPGDNVQILFRLVGGVDFNPTTIAAVMTTPVEQDNGTPAVVNLQRISGGAPPGLRSR